MKDGENVKIHESPRVGDLLVTHYREEQMMTTTNFTEQALDFMAHQLGKTEKAALLLGVQRRDAGKSNELDYTTHQLMDFCYGVVSHLPSLDPARRNAQTVATRALQMLEQKGMVRVRNAPARGALLTDLGLEVGRRVRPNETDVERQERRIAEKTVSRLHADELEVIKVTAGLEKEFGDFATMAELLAGVFQTDPPGPLRDEDGAPTRHARINLQAGDPMVVALQRVLQPLTARGLVQSAASSVSGITLTERGRLVADLLNTQANQED